MKTYRIAINPNSDFAKNVAPFDNVEEELDKTEKLYYSTFTKIHTFHIEICYIDEKPIQNFHETYGFCVDLKRHFPGEAPEYRVLDFETFIARINALEGLLTILDDKNDKPAEEPIVDHDGNYFEDGKYYVYHECKRCHRKIFIKLNDDFNYEYPHHWARHYRPEIEGNLCPSCEEKLSEMKNDLYIRFMEGEKL